MYINKINTKHKFTYNYNNSKPENTGYMTRMLKL